MMEKIAALDFEVIHAVHFKINHADYFEVIRMINFKVNYCYFEINSGTSKIKKILSINPIFSTQTMDKMKKS